MCRWCIALRSCRQNHEHESGESELTKNAFKILYATDEDHEQAAAEGGEGEVLDGDEAHVSYATGVVRCGAALGGVEP